MRANPGLAASLTVFASACVAGTTLLAKALGQGTLGPALHPIQITFGRFAFALTVLILASAILRPTLKPNQAPLHVLRATLGAAGVTLMFAASAMIPLADATAISFLNPIFAMIIAVIVLRERTGPWRWAAAAIAVTGAMVLLRPGAATLELGALVALASAIVIGAEVVCIKTLSHSNTPFQILFTNNVLGILLAGTAALAVWQAPTLGQWIALMAIGGLMVTAQACFTNALRFADASFVSPFWYATLVFAALYDALLFGAWPDLVSYLGIAIILTGGGLLAWREARAARVL